MIRFSVLYPRTEGADFDWTYYLEKHVPLVASRLGPALKGTVIEQGVAAEGGGPAPFVAMAHLSFESPVTLQLAMATHGDELAADVAKFTTIAPVFQISAVKVAR